jgi:hypothetical protein
LEVAVGVCDLYVGHVLVLCTPIDGRGHECIHARLFRLSDSNM